MSEPTFYQRVKPYIYFFLGFLWGGVIVFLCMAAWLKNNIVCEYASHFNFDDTCRKLQENVKKTEGWEIKNVPCALPATLDSDRVQMFKLCNAKYAGAMINHARTRASSCFLPCQFSVYERDGKTYIARLNIGIFGVFLGDPVQTIILDQVLPEQRGILAPLVHK